jgi:hypothetical protein
VPQRLGDVPGLLELGGQRFPEPEQGELVTGLHLRRLDGRRRRIGGGRSAVNRSPAEQEELALAHGQVGLHVVHAIRLPRELDRLVTLGVAPHRAGEVDDTPARVSTSMWVPLTRSSLRSLVFTFMVMVASSSTVPADRFTSGASPAP